MGKSKSNNCTERIKKKFSETRAPSWIKVIKLNWRTKKTFLNGKLHPTVYTTLYNRLFDS